MSTVDFEGKIQRAQIVEVFLDFQKTGLIACYPNPVTGGLLNIKLQSDLDADALVEVFDLNGKQSRQINVSLEGGLNNIEVDVNGLPKGYYIIRVSTENRVFHGKVIVD